MRSLRWGAGAIAIMASAVMTGCHPTFLVVPGAERDTVTDTVRVPDSRTRLSPVKAGPTRVDTVLRTDTVHVPVTRIVVRTDTVVRVDTLVRVDTIAGRPTGSRPTRQPPTPTRVDTVRVVVTDTVVRVDTVRVQDAGTVTGPRRPTGTGTPAKPVNRVDTVRVTSTDTIVRVDTVRVTSTDTIVRVDTVRVAGQRLLFLPPGHEPPEGQCRVWVHGLPPGQQAKAAPCTALGAIPAGAFILFGGDAWDFDYDWLAEAASNPGSVPPEIVALQRRGRGR